EDVVIEVLRPAPSDQPDDDHGGEVDEEGDDQRRVGGDHRRAIIHAGSPDFLQCIDRPGAAQVAQPNANPPPLSARPALRQSSSGQAGARREGPLRGCGTDSTARQTRSASTVAATSWTRTMRAPRCTATRCAATEPWTRSSGPARPVSSPMLRLRDRPASTGTPSSARPCIRPSNSTLCAVVLPNPKPGSTTMLRLAIPAISA